MSSLDINVELKDWLTVLSNNKEYASVKDVTKEDLMDIKYFMSEDGFSMKDIERAIKEMR